MDSFESYRPLMFSIAYRMLGSVMEAEDIVQEAYLRYQAVPAGNIQSPKSFLSTIVTHLCLDQLKSAKERREAYVGPWLPDPILTESALPEPAKEAEDYDSISMAFLVLLESLTPVERAVFLLREVFDYDYAEIAQIVGKEEATCRQLFSRAKKHISENRPRYKSTPEMHNDLLGQFILACQAGDLNGLMSLLAEDVTSWADTGGKTRAATRPVKGRDHVARYFMGVTPRLSQNATIELTDINGGLSLLVRVDGKPFLVLTLDAADGLIRNICMVLNPDKLAHL